MPPPQATAYLEDVRKPLLELLPQLEQRRKDLKIKMLQLRSNVELAQKKHAKVCGYCAKESSLEATPFSPHLEKGVVSRLERELLL